MFSLPGMGEFSIYIYVLRFSHSSGKIMRGPDIFIHPYSLGTNSFGVRIFLLLGENFMQGPDTFNPGKKTFMQGLNYS